MGYKLYIDDSGQLHTNYPNGDYFIYGCILIEESKFHGINQNYKKLVKRIRTRLQHQGELKTSHMNITTRRQLLKQLSKYNCQQGFVTVCVPKLERLDFSKKKDVVRYKNYMVRRLVEKLILDGKLPKNCDSIDIYIDNQNVAHSSLDDLEEHLINYFNEDNYYNVHKKFKTTSFRADIKVSYRDSKTNYMIQAADLLANTKFNSLHCDQDKRTSILNTFKEGYTILHLP